MTLLEDDYIISFILLHHAHRSQSFYMAEYRSGFLMLLKKQNIYCIYIKNLPEAQTSSELVNVLRGHLLIRWVYLQLMPRAQSRDAVWRSQPALCEGHYAFFSLQMGERLSAAPSSDLESKLGTPLPRVEQNVDDISLNRAQQLSFAFSGWTRARPSKYYVRPWREQLEARMNCFEWGAGLWWWW